MNIKEVAARAGLPPKTIRYYEDIGLIRPRRSANGYRSFAEADAYIWHTSPDRLEPVPQVARVALGGDA